MRIAYVTETWPPEINGVALTAQRTVEWLRARQHAVTVIRPRQRADRGAAARDPHSWLVAGLPIPMYKPLRFGLPMTGELRARWQQDGARPDLVHVATEGPLGASAVAAARALGIPVTSDFRTNFHLYSRHYGAGWAAPLVLRYLRWLHNRTQLTCVPTEAVAADLARQGFERTAVVGRGVDVERFSPWHRSRKRRATWGAHCGSVVVLHVGRLAAEKNVALVLRSFHAIKARLPDAVLVWVGDGPLRQRLQRKHRDAVFTGTLQGQALAEAYASSDLFLFPSLTDTFGNVTLEALASGLVVVAFDTGSAAVHVEHGVSGWLVPPGDETWFVEAATDAAVRLRDRPQMRRHATAAAQRANWHTVLGRFESLLLQACAASRAPAALAAPASVTAPLPTAMPAAASAPAEVVGSA